uniref:Uncharacterized protein n=1 Tax=Salix viminalis TaxID=40686 RepID=A0A6N2M9A5_SALVM
MIELAGEFHEFLAGDESHPQSEGIYNALDQLYAIASLIHLRHLHSAASLILTFTAPLVPPFNLCKNHLTNSSALPFSFTLPSPPSPSSSARRTHLISPSLVLAVSATDPNTNLLFL